MALHTDLDIYDDAKQLLAAVLSATKNMRRDLKPMLGQEILRNALRIPILIARANIAKDKEPHLMRILESKEMIEMLSRFSRDQGPDVMTSPAYLAVTEVSTRIGKKTNGWREWNAKRQSREGQGHHD